MARWLTLGVALGVFIPSVSSPPSPAATAARCGPTGARTLAASSGARAYAQGRAAYACAASNGQTVRLGKTSRCLDSTRIGPVTAAGDLVAYAAQFCDIDFGTSTVVVLRPSDRMRLVNRSAFVGSGAGPEDYVSVGSIVVNRSGAVAWIMTDASILTRRTKRRVVESTGSGVHVLAAGTHIKPRSLRLRGSTLTWKAGGSRHSAKLD